MANLLAPTGLVFSRNRAGGAMNVAAQIQTIRRGYASAIGIGDLVKRGTGSDLGYIMLADTNDVNILGVFGGVLGYYNTTTQGRGFGLNGSYVAGTYTPAGVDIECQVYTDPLLVFRAQYSGTLDQTAIGRNVSFASNGAPNASGISTLYLTGVADGSTLPLRIEGFAGVVGGPQDPDQTNPWIEVALNTSSMLAPAGV